MNGNVLVALMGLVVLGVLGIIALATKGRLHWESRTAKRTNKVEIEGSAEGPP